MLNRRLCAVDCNPGVANETFNVPEGPGCMGGCPAARGVELDPLAGSEDANKPLLHRLLAVPGLKARYLAHVRTLAEVWLDWKKLGPLATQYQALIADEVRADTRKLASFDAFQNGVAGDAGQEGFRGRGRVLSLKSIADQRRAYLLNHLDVKSRIPK